MVGGQGLWDWRFGVLGAVDFDGLAVLRSFGLLGPFAFVGVARPSGCLYISRISSGVIP